MTLFTGTGLLGDEVGDLGSAVLLDDLAMGEPARFSLSSGSTVVTSPVRGLEKLGVRAVQLVTRNSTYRFELIQSSD
jgi:pyridoxal/pyridoxine/pyridoxamine kinase